MRKEQVSFSKDTAVWKRQTTIQQYMLSLNKSRQDRMQGNPGKVEAAQRETRQFITSLHGTGEMAHHNQLLLFQRS